MSITSGATTRESASRYGSVAAGSSQGEALRAVPGRHVRGSAVWHVVMRVATGIYVAAVRIASAIVAQSGGGSSGEFDILLTGRFESDNWARAHLGPLAASGACGSLRVVTTWPLSPMDKVTAISPPRWLRRLTGDAAARLLTLGWQAAVRRPDFVGGFHISCNALAALLVARLCGSRAMYFCVGGPVEIIGGGVLGEPSPFKRMATPDAVVERRLLWSACRFDLVVTMGSGGGDYLAHAGASRVEVLSGGVTAEADGDCDGDGEPLPARYDAIVVARLAPIKRLDVLVEAWALVNRQRPGSRLAIVGDGPQRQALSQQAQRLGIDGLVHFAGHQRSVGPWLRQSRLFVLSSDSEGLSLALMEAMAAGLPAVVTGVGDMEDLVRDGVNGMVVPRRDPAALAAAMLGLLEDEPLRTSMARRAAADAARYSPSSAARRWDAILTSFAPEVRP